MSPSQTTDRAGHARVTMPVGQPENDLVHEVLFGPGSILGIDLAAPTHWSSTSFRGRGRSDDPVLTLALGRDAARTIHQHRRSVESHSGPDVPLIVPSATPFLEVATVEALDRWLPFQLDQSLIDAERAAAWARAAHTLPSSTVRRNFIGQGLGLARPAIGGVRTYLEEIHDSGEILPRCLFGALVRLGTGLLRLRREIREPEEDFDQLIQAFRTALNRPSGHSGVRGEARPLTRPPDLAARSTGSASRLDPCQGHARVSRFGAHPEDREVRYTVDAAAGSVFVEVPACEPLAAAHFAETLSMRLVERRTGHWWDGTLSLVTGDADGGSTFRGSAPLHGLRPDQFRVDVFDARSTIPPARTDSDPTLLRFRRAVLFLAHLRGFNADLRLSRGVKGAAERVAQLGRLISTADDDAAPAFRGGPSMNDLMALGRRGDQFVADCFRGRAQAGGPLQPWLDAGLRVARPLTAELAAANRDR